MRAKAAEAAREKQAGAIEPVTDDSDTPYRKLCRMHWASLIKRVYGVDPLCCPQCGGTWDVPNQPGETSRFGFCVDPSELEIDHLSITIRCQQTAVLNDWFEDGGFIAALQRLVITETA